MVFYLLRRVLYAIPIALAVGFVCFMLVQIAPGDPINAIVPPDAPADVVEQVRKDYGLDKPLPVQFGLWLAKVVQAAGGVAPGHGGKIQAGGAGLALFAHGDRWARGGCLLATGQQGGQ